MTLINIFLTDTGGIDWSAIGSLSGGIALIPSLYPYIKEFFSKPKIKIYLDKNLELSTNEFNSTLSIRAMFHTIDKDAFIDDMKLIVKHESGKIKIYNWSSLVENISMANVNGVVVPTDKFFRAIGYKTFKDQAVSTGMTFIYSDYKKAYDELTPKLLELRYKHLTTNTNLKQIELNEHFISMINACNKYLHWDSGKYECELQLTTIEKNIFSKEFKFTLSQDSANSINNFNIKIATDNMKNHYARNKEDIDNYDKEKAINIPTYLNIIIE